ncbi:hypothetical protein EVAR_87528_1 [Eumeta japonica]|uniref:Uncharacterized protein n=1 Tax=Eumeta variegata TaxID=151549 RepID=A0A4C1XRE2_EUMVA|nr:hypothetical protein EVAR_87528_1 [Eumeta japonica]
MCIRSVPTEYILNNLEPIQCFRGGVSEDQGHVCQHRPYAHFVNSAVIAPRQFAFSTKHGSEPCSVENCSFSNAFDVIFKTKTFVERDS